jgi:nucleoside-diphosphate-sugar epimerase
MLKILVTGGTSSIGLHLVSKLKESGFEVIVFGGRHSSTWTLGEKIPSSTSADILIHLAHDRAFSVNATVTSTKAICSSFKGPKVYLSSLSAHEKSISKYGISKFESERIFLNSGSTILRAGVVYGPGVTGIFGMLNKLVKLLYIIPIPYRGVALLYTTHIDDLVNEILQQINQPKNRIIFAAHTFPLSFYELISRIIENIGTYRVKLSLQKQPFELFVKSLLKLFPNFTLLDSFLSLSKSCSNEELSKLEHSYTQFRAFDLKY